MKAWQSVGKMSHVDTFSPSMIFVRGLRIGSETHTGKVGAMRKYIFFLIFLISALVFVASHLHLSKRAGVVPFTRLLPLHGQVISHPSAIPSNPIQPPPTPTQTDNGITIVSVTSLITAIASLLGAFVSLLKELREQKRALP